MYFSKNHLNPISHKTRLGTPFLYDIIGYTRVNWYEYWAPTVPWHELDSNVARVCTNKALIYSVEQGLLRFEHDLSTILYDCFTVPSTVKYGLVRLNTTFTRYTRHSQGLHTSRRLSSSYPQFTHSCMFDINWLILMAWHHTFNEKTYYICTVFMHILVTCIRVLQPCLD